MAIKTITYLYDFDSGKPTRVIDKITKILSRMKIIRFGWAAVPISRCEDYRRLGMFMVCKGNGLIVDFLSRFSEMKGNDKDTWFWDDTELLALNSMEES